MVEQRVLEKLYLQKRYSVSEISKKLGISQGQINYYLEKYGIQKRSIRDSAYLKWNPNGDPFKVSRPNSINAAFLFGLGMGLYWGEGTKMSKTLVRLANSDPRLILSFLNFLKNTCGIDALRLRCGLQIFGDMNVDKALSFWSKKLKIPVSRFYKLVVTPHRGVGNYRQKTKYGVLTIYFNNRKLRDILVAAIERIDGKADVAQLVEHVLGGSQTPAHLRSNV